MPRLIAKEAFAYDSRALSVGDEFNACDEHAKILTIIGRAEAAQEQEDAPAPKRRGRPPKYLRRDMRAED